MDVAAWLRDLGLERYVSAFRDRRRGASSRPTGGASLWDLTLVLPFPSLPPAPNEQSGISRCPRKSGSQLTRRWREADSNLYGAFRVKWLFLVLLPVLCSERERPFFVPSPAIRFAERAEGVTGPKR
jgi:hypothetical protein